jgi:hypothetical protein
MASPPSISETEMGTWIFRVAIAVVGFLLAIAVKDAKKSLDQVPALIAKIEGLEKAQDDLFSRILELERGHR